MREDMGSSLQYWVSLALTVLATMVMTLVAALRQGSAFKDRTLLAEFRFYFHLMLPYITIFCLLNVGWRLALGTFMVWVLGLAFTPFYVSHFEHLAERTRNIDAARKGTEPVMYLRSFAAADAMPGIENLLEQSAGSYEASDDLRFQLNLVALGYDDRSGFPKLPTQDSDWWQQFEDLAEKSAAIFLLPISAYSDAQAGIVRETAHVFMHHAEKVIVVVPDAETWQRLPRALGESFDARTRWNEVRHHLSSVGPLVSIPDYLPSGFVFYMARSDKSTLRYHSLALSTTGVKSALSEVTLKRRQESKQARKDFEAEFKALNGVAYSDYYKGSEKKLPPIMPV